MRGIKFKPEVWLNTSNGETIWGIKAYSPTFKKWAYCCEGAEPLFYSTKEEAEARIKELEREAE